MSETITDKRQILLPFDKRECLTLRQAAAVAGKSESTTRAWCDNSAWAVGSGRYVGGQQGRTCSIFGRKLGIARLPRG
jgi:hypothetical protein